MSILFFLFIFVFFTLLFITFTIFTPSFWRLFSTLLWLSLFQWVILQLFNINIFFIFIFWIHLISCFNFLILSSYLFVLIISHSWLFPSILSTCYIGPYMSLTIIIIIALDNNNIWTILFSLLHLVMVPCHLILVPSEIKLFHHSFLL